MINAKYIQIGLVAGAVGIGGWLLISGTGASLGTLLLIGLVLLCPLMMLGMNHGGHQQGGDSDKSTLPTDKDSQATPRPHVR